MCEPATTGLGALRTVMALKPAFSKSQSMICRKTSYMEDGIPAYPNKNSLCVGAT